MKGPPHRHSIGILFLRHYNGNQYRPRKVWHLLVFYTMRRGIEGEIMINTDYKSKYYGLLRRGSMVRIHRGSKKESARIPFFIGKP
jgi:hypothetical protein